MRGRFKREGTNVCLWQIHVDVWQKATQYCKAIICQLKISKFKSIYARDLGEEESTGLEVAICQTPCQALNIFSLLSHEHCAKLLQNPTAQKRKLRIQEDNQFPHSHRNTNVLSYQHTLVPRPTLHRSKKISSTVLKSQSHSRVLGFLLPSDIRGIRYKLPPSSVSLPVHFEGAISFSQVLLRRGTCFCLPLHQASFLSLTHQLSLLYSALPGFPLPNTPSPQHTHMHRLLIP